VVRGGHGARISLPGRDPFVALFSESSARAIVTVTPSDVAAFEALAGAHGVEFVKLGAVEGSRLEVVGQFGVDVEELRAISAGVLSAVFD